MKKNEFALPLTANPHIIMRRFGYAPYMNRQGQSSYVRRVTGYEFPRFHLYILRTDVTTLTCTLHIDQKAPMMKGAAAHAGDYDSPQVFAEIQRLRG